MLIVVLFFSITFRIIFCSRVEVIRRETNLFVFLENVGMDTNGYFVSYLFKIIKIMITIRVTIRVLL